MMKKVMKMKDIPMFTTDYGVASIILKEVPYRALAFIHIQDVQPGEAEGLVEECVQFCRAAGAEKVLAAGHEELERYPYDHSVIAMSGAANPAPEANLWPVTRETVSKWREIYNERMKDVDNAATLTAFDEKELVSASGTYFVHDAGRLLGIGWAEDGKLKCVASVEKGAGRRVLSTLLSALDCERVELEVASTNEKAIRLYEAMGFIKTGEVSRWYRVL